MAKQERVAQIIPRIRDGEGVTVTTTRRMVPQPDGTASFELSIDMGNAPVPERRYAADIASVTYRDGAVYLIFGQKKLAGTSLRSMVVLTMSSLGILNFLKGFEGLPAPAVNQFLSPELLLPADKLGDEPGEVVNLASNIILGAFSGREACFDFYFVSPYVLGQLAQSGKFAVDPVVRITLHSGLANAIIKCFQSLKSEFPQDEIDQVWKGAKLPKEGHA
jgi:hypothetical protein